MLMNLSVQAGVDYGDLLITRDGDSAGIINPGTMSWEGVSSEFNVQSISANLNHYAYGARGSGLRALVFNLSDLQRRPNSSPEDWQSSITGYRSIDAGVDGSVYGAREGYSALRMEPDSLDFAGGADNQTDLTVSWDISMGVNYGYLARKNTSGDYLSVVLIDKDDLDYLGVQTHMSGGNEMSGIISVDYGVADGYVYCARDGSSALQFNADTLEWTGLQTKYSNGSNFTDLIDVSMGVDGYLYGVTSAGDVAKFDSSLTLVDVYDVPGIATSIDVAMIPEPGSLTLFIVGSASAVFLRSKSK